jgi:hypothetical protein
MIFHERPSSGSRVIPCGQADGHTDIKKLIFVFRNFVNAPTKQCTKQDKAELLMYFLF